MVNTSLILCSTNEVVLLYSLSGLVHELFEVPCPHKPFNLILENNTTFGIMPYILMEGIIFLDAPA